MAKRKDQKRIDDEVVDQGSVADERPSEEQSRDDVPERVDTTTDATRPPFEPPDPGSKPDRNTL